MLVLGACCSELLISLSGIWSLSQHVGQRALQIADVCFSSPFVFVSSTSPRLFHFVPWQPVALLYLNEAGPGPQPLWLGHLSRGCWHWAQQTAPCRGLLFALGLQSTRGTWRCPLSSPCVSPSLTSVLLPSFPCRFNKSLTACRRRLH